MTNEEQILSQEVFFRLSGTGEGPWEIGRPQSVVIKLVEQGVFQGEVLDVGCGIAENAIYIGSHTHNTHITAIDLVPKAIEISREKAREANVDAQFEVIDFSKDVSKTNLKKQGYDIILDAAVFHFLSNEDRQQYRKNLEYLIKPGGLYIQLSFSEKESRNSEVRRTKLSDLKELFSSTDGWTIESVEDAIYDSKPKRYFPGGAQAYLCLIRRNKASI